MWLYGGMLHTIITTIIEVGLLSNIEYGAFRGNRMQTVQCFNTVCFCFWQKVLYELVLCSLYGDLFHLYESALELSLNPKKLHFFFAIVTYWSASFLN